jgi:hypothetical protein
MKHPTEIALVGWRLFLVFTVVGSCSGKVFIEEKEDVISLGNEILKISFSKDSLTILEISFLNKKNETVEVLRRNKNNGGSFWQTSFWNKDGVEVVSEEC